MGRWRGRAAFSLVALVVLGCGGESIRHEDESSAGRGDGSSGGTSGAVGGGNAGRGSCEWDGAVFPLGSGRTEEDGCTVCECTPTGMKCDSNACPHGAECEATAVSYERLVQAARACDPANQTACNGAVASRLPCGCQVPIISTSEIAATARRWVELGCDATPVLCPPCPSAEPPFGCSADGLCTMR